MQSFDYELPLMEGGLVNHFVLQDVTLSIEKWPLENIDGLNDCLKLALSTLNFNLSLCWLCSVNSPFAYAACEECCPVSCWKSQMFALVSCYSRWIKKAEEESISFVFEFTSTRSALLCAGPSSRFPDVP